MHAPLTRQTHNDSITVTHNVRERHSDMLSSCEFDRHLGIHVASIHTLRNFDETDHTWVLQFGEICTTELHKIKMIQSLCQIAPNVSTHVWSVSSLSSGPWNCAIYARHNARHATILWVRQTLRHAIILWVRQTLRHAIIIILRELYIHIDMLSSWYHHRVTWLRVTNRPLTRPACMPFNKAGMYSL
jgi:hypothetical protein